MQFKYGDTWQHAYELGDRLRWGGNEIGEPGRRLVLVHGLAEACPFCEQELPPVDVVIEQDILLEIRVPGDPRTEAAAEGYFVLE